MSTTNTIELNDTEIKNNNDKSSKKGPIVERYKKLEDIVKVFLKRKDTESGLKSLTLGAIRFGCSDIHYDNTENDIVIRFRIDGILVDIFRLEKKDYKLFLERLKHSSNLKLNITNVPQDGKYSLYIEEEKIDVRVSTLPTPHGENIVCRLLDSKRSIINFEELGFIWTAKRNIEKVLEKNNGLVLVTGPTGSGKTTTLYTMISKLNTRERKIITLEDPIEYVLDGINQSEVSEKQGYTFDMGLKAILRQDPDVIMVGEIRDYETLEIATQASLTGHLVLSTLHTKSAADTLDRMLNMGLPKYILSSSLDTIISQRLVRKICPYCKVEIEKTNEDLKLLKEMKEQLGIENIDSKYMKLYTGKGCKRCNYTGLKGRIGIYEIMTLNNKLRDLIREGAPVNKIIEEARKHDMISMKEDGILKALKGLTTIKEILRVI